MITVKEESPLARAVRTKSDDSTASIEARVMRAIGASEKMASVSAGRGSRSGFDASGLVHPSTLMRGSMTP